MVILRIKGDCNDNNIRIYPGAIDICGDSIDQDCDGVDSVCQGPEYDNDLDGYSENQGDCNDNNNRIYPGAIDICGDSIDQDCNGVDSVCQQSWIVGSWNLTHLDGVPAGVSYSSIWTFNSDGTYSLFFYAPPYYDERGGGDYNLSGNNLTVSGIATQIFGYSTQVSVPLTVSSDNNTFSFVDDEWDRWIYSKL